MPLRSFAADDIFISYTRRDASTYAAGLADELTKRGFSCFIDKLGTDPNADLPDMLKRKIKSCAMLVVVCTERAGTRQTIEEEIGEFLRTGRRTSVVPVDFGDAVYKARWYSLVEGIAPEPEKNPQALDDGNPSPSVISRIEKQFNYARRSQRLRRVTYATAGVLVVLLLASVVAGVYAAQQLKVAKAASAAAENARTEAAGERLKADDARREAGAAQAEANKARGEAAEQTRLAGLAADDAKQKGRLAAEKTRLADEATRQAKTAEASRVVAQAEAERQQAIAGVRALANQSESLLRQRPGAARRSLSLAVDSMKKANAIGLRSVEADTALRASLAVMPRLRRTDTYTDPSILYTALSPDGRHFAARNWHKKMRFYESGSQTPLKEVDCDCWPISLSSGLAYAAVFVNGGPGERFIRIVDLKDDARSHSIRIEDFIKGIAISPGGRYVAYFDHSSDVRVLDAASGKLVAALDKADTDIQAIAFGPSGNLAVGGAFSRKGQASFGQVVMWSLPLNSAGGKAEPELTDASFSDFEVISTQDSQVDAIALGADNTYFATDTAVWKRFPGQSRYEVVARLTPSTQEHEVTQVNCLAFSLGGEKLSVIRQVFVKNSEWHRLLEVWDTTGHRAMSWEIQSDNGIGGVSFKPGGHLVAAKSTGRLENPRRMSMLAQVFRPDDGVEVSDVTDKPGAEEDYDKLDFSAPADYIISRSAGAVLVWDVWGRKKTKVPFDPKREVAVVAVSPGGKFLAVSSTTKEPEEDGRPEVVVYRFDGGSYREWKRLRPQQAVLAMSLSADGRLLAGITIGENVATKVWEVSSGRDVTPPYSLKKLSEVGMLRLSHSGRYLLAGGGRNCILLDLSNGRDVSPPFDATISAIAFSPDERHLALGSKEGMVHIFETAHPEDEVARLLHTGEITAIAFSDDGKYVATGSSVGHQTDLLSVWLLQSEDLLAEAAAR